MKGISKIFFLSNESITSFSKREDFQLIPILVGSLDSSKLEKYGQLLASYLCDPKNLFVISSDFCHWGRRFSYTPHNPADGEIWQHIEKLDHQGMDLIETMNLQEFQKYLRATDNTICGRYPISLLLAVGWMNSNFYLIKNLFCFFL